MKHITVEELKIKMEDGIKMHLLDVRELSEYEEFNIGGIHIPLGKIQSFQIEDIDEFKDDEIIIHCRSGIRSVTAALFLEMQGFKNVSNLLGGLVAWQEKFGNTFS